MNKMSVQMEAEVLHTSKVLLTVVLGGFIGLLIHLYNVLMLKPERLRLKLRRQGIKGPSPSLFVGNIPQMKKMQLQLQSTTNHRQSVALSHDWASTVFPYFHQWRIEYGTLFVLYYSISSPLSLSLSLPLCVC